MHDAPCAVQHDPAAYADNERQWCEGEIDGLFYAARRLIHDLHSCGLCDEHNRLAELIVSLVKCDPTPPWALNTAALYDDLDFLKHYQDAAELLDVHRSLFHPEHPDYADDLAADVA